MKWGILFRWGSWWIGGHWSDHNRRLCVNPVPMITVWITREGGETPDVGYGFDIYRSDKHQPKKNITITNVVDHKLIDAFIKEAKANAKTKKEIESNAREKLLADQEARLDAAIMEIDVKITSPARLTLIKLIEQTNLSDDDLYFLSVIMTGFFAVPPATLFQQLRSEPELSAPKGDSLCPPEDE